MPRRGQYSPAADSPEALRALEPRYWRNIDRPNGGGSLVLGRPSALVAYAWPEGAAGVPCCLHHRPYTFNDHQIGPMALPGKIRVKGRARFVREWETRP